jgi:hypothetical protein
MAWRFLLDAELPVRNQEVCRPRFPLGEGFFDPCKVGRRGIGPPIHRQAFQDGRENPDSPMPQGQNTNRRHPAAQGMIGGYGQNSRQIDRLILSSTTTGTWLFTRNSTPA